MNRLKKKQKRKNRTNWKFIYVRAIAYLLRSTLTIFYWGMLGIGSPEALTTLLVLSLLCDILSVVIDADVMQPLIRKFKKDILNIRQKIKQFTSSFRLEVVVSVKIGKR